MSYGKEAICSIPLASLNESLARDAFVEDGALMIVASMNRAGGKPRAAFGQMLVHQFEHPAAHVMTLQKMAELTDRRLIGHGFMTKVDPGEPAHGGGIIQTYAAPGSDRLNHC